jgi:hypothetical protein
MVFNDATFNNISIISLRSVLLVEETGVPEKTTYLPQVTDKLYKGRSPSNGKLSDFSFYIDSQKSAHRKFQK